MPVIPREVGCVSHSQREDSSVWPNKDWEGTQRVSIARCTVSDPKTYIFDEATSGLDVISSKVILDFIKEERDKGKSIIYSTHYMEEAENICDRVVLIHKGKIVKEGTPKDIIKETETTNLRDAFFKIIGGVTNE